ncbi:TlpA family protein disulfide reductase [Bacteroidales bacterium OttesenSCG-928-M11]|nr:TlpA family protein disulfide reductase [Bacteroidales bacterium OttesenSCG-928-M11]
MLRTSLIIIATLLCSICVSAQQIPSISLKTVEGKTINTAELDNEGKPIIISFWATWCKPCLRELNAIHEMYEEWQEETGLKLVAVSTDEAQNVNRVKPLVDRFGWEYEVWLDPNGDFKRAMNAHTMPTVIIIDGKGNIVETRYGYTDGSETHLIEKVRELIEQED